jgi:hypothetical protein
MSRAWDWDIRCMYISTPGTLHFLSFALRLRHEGIFCMHSLTSYTLSLSPICPLFFIFKAKFKRVIYVGIFIKITIRLNLCFYFDDIF